MQSLNTSHVLIYLAKLDSGWKMNTGLNTSHVLIYQLYEEGSYCSGWV